MTEVSFPVFRLTNKKPEREDNVLYYRNSYINQDTNVISTNVKIVDSKDEPGETLAHRRLQLQQQKVPLYPLRTAVYFLGDFIKLAKSNYWFIDSNGKIFTYKKTTSVKLRFRKIKKIIPSASTGSILEIEGIAERFKTLFRVSEFYRYAGILEYRGISILYGVYETKYNDTRRMI